MPKDMKLSMLIDVYAPVLTEKQREVIEYYYYDDLSLAEIAENCGITRQGVRDSIKRAETVILDLEDKLGFSKIFQKNAEAREIIEKNAKEIVSQNSGSAWSEPVLEAAKNILTALGDLGDK